MNEHMSYALKYYHKNRELINKRRRELNKVDPSIKEKARLRGRRFYRIHGSSYVHDKDKYQSWKLNNPDKYKALVESNRIRRRNKYRDNITYREREKKRLVEYNIVRTHNSRCDGSKLTRKILREVYSEYNYTCASCGRTKEEARLSIDHIKPISKGGTNIKSNLQILCLSCNQRKSSKF